MPPRPARLGLLANHSSNLFLSISLSSDQALLNERSGLDPDCSVLDLSFGSLREGEVGVSGSSRCVGVRRGCVGPPVPNGCGVERASEDGAVDEPRRRGGGTREVGIDGDASFFGETGDEGGESNGIERMKAASSTFCSCTRGTGDLGENWSSRPSEEVEDDLFSANLASSSRGMMCLTALPSDCCLSSRIFPWPRRSIETRDRA